MNRSGLKLFMSKPPSDYDESRTLFLSALPSTTTSHKIKDLFQNYCSSIVDIRVVMSNKKHLAYVDFDSAESKQTAFEELKASNPAIDGKRVLIQLCNSSRQKKLVLLLKGISFKA